MNHQLKSLESLKRKDFSGVEEMIPEADEDTEKSITDDETDGESNKEEDDDNDEEDDENISGIKDIEIEEDVEDPDTITELSYREYNIETNKDKSGTFEIRGLAAARAPGNMFVCDQGNKCIKYIDGEFNVINRYPVIQEPWDVAVIDGTQFVVTFPFVRMIQYFKINNTTRIIPWFPVKAQNEYYGVCADMDNIIVTCKYNGETNSSVPSVHVLDRQGTVVRVIEKNGRGEHLFIDPNYIALNASTQVVYVSDQGSKEIVCLSVSGTIFTRFSAVNFDPMGITVDESNGNVFVSNKVSVIQFNRNLKRMKTIKCRETTMENVIALTHCSKSDRLIVNKDTSPYLTVFTV